MVRSGEKVKLIWDVTAADNLEIDGLPAISGTNGFMETTLTQTTEFMLKVSNADGSRTSKVRIIVDDRPVIQVSPLANTKSIPAKPSPYLGILNMQTPLVLTGFLKRSQTRMAPLRSE